MFCLASELRRTSAASKKDVMTTSHHIVVLTFLLVFHACGPKRPSPVAIRLLLNSLHVALKSHLVDLHKVKPARHTSIVCKLQGAPIQNVSRLNHSRMTRSLRVAFNKNLQKSDMCKTFTYGKDFRFPNSIRSDHQGANYLQSLSTTCNSKILQAIPSHKMSFNVS